MARKRTKRTIIKDSNKKDTIKPEPNNTVETLEYLLELAKENKIECFVFAGYSNGEEIITSYCDTSVLDHQALVAYLSSMSTIRMLNKTIELDDL